MLTGNSTTARCSPTNDPRKKEKKKNTNPTNQLESDKMANEKIIKKHTKIKSDNLKARPKS